MLTFSQIFYVHGILISGPSTTSKRLCIPNNFNIKYLHFISYIPKLLNWKLYYDYCLQLKVTITFVANTEAGIIALTSFDSLISFSDQHKIYAFPES